MRYYPVNLAINAKKCLVVGGGAVAERKILTLLAAGAVLTVISPQVTARIKALADLGKLIWHERTWQAGDLEGCYLAILATNQPEINQAARIEASRLGVLVNVVDDPSRCDFTLPAIISRDELLITVSTGGESPMLARRIKERLERQYNQDFGVYLKELAAIREQLKLELSTSAKREEFWRQALDDTVLDLVSQGKLHEAKEKIWHEINLCRH